VLIRGSVGVSHSRAQEVTSSLDFRHSLMVLSYRVNALVSEEESAMAFPSHPHLYVYGNRDSPTAPGAAAAPSMVELSASRCAAAGRDCRKAAGPVVPPCGCGLTLSLPELG
jgi:hypothetical protein